MNIAFQNQGLTSSQNRRMKELVFYSAIARSFPFFSNIILHAANVMLDKIGIVAYFAILPISYVHYERQEEIYYRAS